MRRLLVACCALAVGCTETTVRCREGYVSAGGEGDALRCALADAAVTDVSADVSLDVIDAGGDVTDAGEMDACRADAEDLPGDGLDPDCDGVDGVLSRTVFVSPAGDDTADGLSPARPVRTLDRGLSVAVSAGRDSVLVAVGDYPATARAVSDGGPELPFYDLPDGVSISGRYEGGWLRRATEPASVTTLRGVLAGARANGLQRRVVLSDLVIVGESPSGTIAEATVYGLFVVDSADVALRRVTLRAGRGGPGRDGDDGAAVTGAPMVGSTATSAAVAMGGAGCSVARGGAGGVNTAGMMGSAGAAPDGLTPAMGGAAGVMGSGEGGEGGIGAPGADGAPVQLGEFGVFGYVPAESGRGGEGGEGGGGGGGGASATTAGGGGGGGGCGGHGAQGGTGGGASVGLFVWGMSSRVAVTDGRIETADGGMGGSGGAGTMGTDGAMGGGAFRAAGSGGRGGHGGRGGNGGRGGGGPSLGVVAGPGATVTVSDATEYALGAGGAPGTRGAGVIPSGLQQRVYRVTP